MVLNRTPDGIELYFPPCRAPAAALSLALFGVASLIPGLFAAIAVAPLSAAGAAGELALWLMSVFILPFIVFGVLFLGIAGYGLANSLTVVVTPTHVRTVRRILGLPLRERHVAQAEISALEAVATRRYRWLRDEVPLYDLVVTTKRVEVPIAAAGTRSRTASIKVAEALRGEELMEKVRTEIAAAARLDRPA